MTMERKRGNVTAKGIRQGNGKGTKKEKGKGNGHGKREL